MFFKGLQEIPACGSEPGFSRSTEEKGVKELPIVPFGVLLSVLRNLKRII